MWNPSGDSLLTTKALIELILLAFGNKIKNFQASRNLCLFHWDKPAAYLRGNKIFRWSY